MDKVLFIDAHNAMWRACSSFGPPIKHEQCDHTQPKYANISHGTDGPHCVCRSPWDVSDNHCYGEKYAYVFNFFRNLRPIIEDFAPDKCFFVLEGHPHFRYQLYGDYKANRIIKQASRQEASEKFTHAKDIILPLMQYLPITTCRAAKFEADDVIGTLCNNLATEDLTVLSSDSDYIQLLQKGYHNLQIYNPIKKTFMEAPTYPYVPWKCLNGDKSDNIPAILKPKKALETVQDPTKFKAFLEVEENRANFSINRQLIEFGVVPEDDILLQEGVRNFAILKLAFAQMKFESIINDKSWDKYHKTFDCLKY